MIPPPAADLLPVSTGQLARRVTPAPASTDHPYANRFSALCARLGGILYQIPNAAFDRMLRDPLHHRLPRFADKRVRSAEIAVALMNRKAIAVERSTFSILTFKKNGALVSPLSDRHAYGPAVGFRGVHKTPHYRVHRTWVGSSRPKAVIHHNELVAMKRPFAACGTLTLYPINSVAGRIRHG